MDYQQKLDGLMAECKRVQEDNVKDIPLLAEISYGDSYKHKVYRDRFGYHEFHHIIPKHIKEDNSHSNLVALRASDHVLAHYYLAKIHGGHLWLPLIRMSKLQKATLERYSDEDIIRKVAPLFEEARIEHAKYLSEKKKGKPEPNFTAQHEKVRSTEVHHYQNIETGEVFSGTYTEASEHTGIPSNKLSEVASGVVPSRNGWTIRGREIIPSHVQKRNNKRYEYVNLETGEKVVASRWEMADKYGYNAMSWGNMAEGRPKTYHGWTVEDGRVITAGRFANTTHAAADSTLYKWENTKTGEVREALQSDMRKEFGSRGFEAVLNGRQHSCQGWKIAGTELADNKPIYKWENIKTGEIRETSVTEMRDNFDSKWFSEVAGGRNHSCKGWKIAGTELADNRGDTDVYKLKQAASGEIIEGRPKDFAARFGRGNYAAVLRGEEYMARGLVRVDHTPTTRQKTFAARYLDD